MFYCLVMTKEIQITHTLNYKIVISAISTVHALKVSLSKLRSQSMLRHSRRLSQLNSGSREPNSRERTSLGLNHGKAKNDCEH